MSKQSSIVPNVPGFSVGQNIIGWEQDGILLLAIDTQKTGPQTENSKAPGKEPNMMVASTRSFIHQSGGKLMLHYTRPMEVQAVRSARATRELDEEDAIVENAKLAKLRAQAKANPELAALLTKAGV